MKRLRVLFALAVAGLVAVPLAANAQPIGPPPIHVGSARAAQRLLSFRVVLPSSATPVVITVSDPKSVVRRKRGVTAFFETRGIAPYEVNEERAGHLSGEPSTVGQLRTWARTCKNRVVCPIHRIVTIHHTQVLLIGAPGQPGGLTVFWLRHDRPHSILTWIQGPKDYAHGDLPRHRFKPSAALAAAAQIIRQGG